MNLFPFEKKRLLTVISANSIVIRQHNAVRTAIWVYFWLLIFEGALRKWIFPGLAAPILIIRDPIAIYVLVSAWICNRFPVNGYVITLLAVSLIGTFSAVLIGHGSLPVALFGARIFLIQFPLIFIIGDYFTEKDVVKMGRIILYLTLPMAILITFQFYSPQSSWVNRGIGGNIEGAGFSGALGYFRPPATFSFITGTSSFFSLSAGFICYFWLNKKSIYRLLLLSATIGLLVAIPLSISRTLFFLIILTLFFTVITAVYRPKFLGKFISALIGMSILLGLLYQLEIFQISLSAFFERFSSASRDEGGIEGTFIDRFLGGMLGVISNDSRDLPFLGHGLGMGTNVGAQLLVGNRNVFLISEGEWGRLIGELGLFLGLIVIMVRSLTVIDMLTLSYKNLKKGNALPWILCSVGVNNLLQGQWAQPNQLGFGILVGGLILASNHNKHNVSILKISNMTKS